MDRLTPRERAIYEALTARAEALGADALELASATIARLEAGTSAGMLRLDPPENPRPMIGWTGE